MRTSARRERYERLAAHPFLAGLRRSELRRWARAADEVALHEGDVLLAEGRIGYWFFLITEGVAVATTSGEETGQARAGDHIGDLAALCFYPQPATVTARTPMRAFVVGRRHFVGLAYDTPAVHRRLFPDLADRPFADMVRDKRAAAAVAWHALRPAEQVLTGRRGLPRRIEIRPGRLVSSTFPSWPLLGGRQAAGESTIERYRLGWRARVALAVLPVAAIAVAGLAYHPPMALISARPPIDVTGDIVVQGAPVRAVNGRYLLLTVKLDRPNAYGALLAVIRNSRRTRVAGTTGAAGPRPEDLFRQSQQYAAAAAALWAGIDVHMRGDGVVVVDAGNSDQFHRGDVIVALDGVAVRTAPELLGRVAASGSGSSIATVERDGIQVEVPDRPAAPVAAAIRSAVLETRNATFSLPFTVTFRHRSIGGPSGGLVYALALADMLGTRDLAGGRTIAATGAIDPTGQVLPVGFVADKMLAAARGHATDVFVPRPEAAGLTIAGGTRVHPVVTLDDATRQLAS